MSWPGTVTSSARAKLAFGPDAVVDGRHLSFTRSLSFVPDDDRPIERILTVFGRNTPPRERSGTETFCSPVHTLDEVGRSAWIDDWSAARSAL